MKTRAYLNYPETFMAANYPTSAEPLSKYRRDLKAEIMEKSSNPRSTLATKTVNTKNPNLDVINKTLTYEDRIKLIRDQKCLWC